MNLRRRPWQEQPLLGMHEHQASRGEGSCSWGAFSLRFLCQLLSRAWMMLTAAVKLDSTAFLEANQKETSDSTGRKRPVMGTPEIWIQTQLWDHERVTSLWTWVSSSVNPSKTSAQHLSSPLRTRGFSVPAHQT